MHFVDLTFSDRIQGNPLEAKALVDMGNVFLIPGDPVQRLGADYVEPTSRGVLKHPDRAIPAADGGARDRLVMIATTDGPALSCSIFTAQVELIFYGTRVLKV